MNDSELLAAITEIRTWIRAATYPSVKSLLEVALTDEKSRTAYQALDGTASLEQVRVRVKLSPHTLGELTQRLVAMGLMEVTKDNRRRRLFDLHDFLLVESKADGKTSEAQKKR